MSDFSIIIPTWNRCEELHNTLLELRKFQGKIAEVLVYVDGGDTLTIAALEGKFPDVVFIQGDTNLGPGGGRNILLEKSVSPYILSLDDDSFPVTSNFFETAERRVKENSHAGIIACVIFHQFEIQPPVIDQIEHRGFFEGCGCIYRKEALKGLPGYVPVQWAYGVEEQDMALQLMDKGWDIILDKSLIVFHNTSLQHHNDPRKNAAAIANRALLAYLRFPMRFAWLGLAMYVNRILWSIKSKRIAGVLKGIMMTPGLLYQYRSKRAPVSVATIRKWRSIEHG